jgi:hypothetical protein
MRGRTGERRRGEKNMNAKVDGAIKTKSSLNLIFRVFSPSVSFSIFLVLKTNKRREVAWVFYSISVLT